MFRKYYQLRVCVLFVLRIFETDVNSDTSREKNEWNWISTFGPSWANSYFKEFDDHLSTHVTEKYNFDIFYLGCISMITKKHIFSNFITNPLLPFLSVISVQDSWNLLFRHPCTVPFLCQEFYYSIKKAISDGRLVLMIVHLCFRWERHTLAHSILLHFHLIFHTNLLSWCYI